MNALAVLNELADYGVVVTGDGERLRVTGPAVFLNQYMRDWLRPRKAEIAALLAGDWTGAALAMLVRLGGKVPDDALRALAEQFEERAAIVQYDGNLPRNEAERIAYEQIAASASQVEAEARKFFAQGWESGVNFDPRECNQLKGREKNGKRL